MLLTSALLLLVRCLTIVLLGISGGRALSMGFVLADLGLYLLVKVMIGDWWYW